MAGTLKAIAVFIVTMVVAGGVMSYLGLPDSSTASTRHHAVTISPEQITRASGPMPVQLVENYQ